MTNEELVNRIKASVDIADNMAALWQQNKNFVHMIANKFQGQADQDDLMQEGFIGLCNAIDGYDPDGGGKFLTYASHWIRQAMQRYIENNGTVRVPVHRQADIRKYNRVVSDFRKNYGREPEIRELMNIFYMPYKDIVALEKAAQCLHISSIETPVGDEGTTLGELLPGCEGIEDDIIQSVDLEALKGILWPLVDELPGQQPAVIRARFKDGLTLKETGDLIGQTSSQARQEESKALRELRKPCRSRQLQPYYEDYLAGAMYHIGVASFNRTWTSEVELAVLGR